MKGFSITLILYALFMVLIMVLPERVGAADWTGYRGPNRDGISKDSGLLKKWPENGPPLVWKFSKLGSTLNGPCVVGNMIYIIGKYSGSECVFCLDSTTGKPLWARPIGKLVGGGPYPMQRCTPSYRRGKLYVVSTAGNLVCMDSGSGKVFWSNSLIRNLGGVMPRGGYAESPLVDGKWVIVTPGGPQATMVALDRHFPRIVWAAKSGAPAGYSSIIKASFGGEHQYVQYTANGPIGVKVRGGDVRWRYEGTAHGSGVNINTPLWFGQTILTSSAQGTGVIWIQKEGDAFRTKEVYLKDDLQIPSGEMININGYVYGCTSDLGLICFNYKTGELLWSDDSLFPETESDKKLPAKSKSDSTLPGAPRTTLPGAPRTTLPGAPKTSAVQDTLDSLLVGNELFHELTDTEIPSFSSSAAYLGMQNVPGGIKIPRSTGVSPIGTKKRLVTPPLLAKKMATMTYADGMLYVRTSRGELVLVEVSGKKFIQKGKMTVSRGKGGLGVTPVVANGFLYVRDGNTLYCYDVREGGSKASSALPTPKSGTRQPSGPVRPSLPGMPQGPSVRPRTPPRVG